MATSLARSLGWAFYKLITVCNLISAVMIFIVMIYMTASVVGLFFFSRAVPGTVGFAKVMLPLIVFLSITYTLRVGGHVRTGLLYDRLDVRGKALVDSVNGILGFAAFAVIAYYAAKLAHVSWVSRDFLDGVLRVPVYPTRFAVFLGSVMIALEFALQSGRSLATLAGLKELASH